MKTLFLRSSFILACASTAFASFNNEKAEMLNKMHRNFMTAGMAQTPIDFTIESNNQTICLSDKTNNDTVCFTKEELIFLTTIASIYSGKPLARNDIAVLEKSTIPNFRASLKADKNVGANVSIDRTRSNILKI